MKSIRQLLRQPMKTLFGVILIALAVAVLCVCLGQSFAAKETEQRLNDTFMTIALPSAEYTKEADQWVLNYASKHPEVVKTVGNPGLIGAYIPELSPDNYTAHICVDTYNTGNTTYNTKRFYSSAVVEITLTKLGEPSTQWAYVDVEANTIEYVEAPGAGVYFSYEGVIENIIGLADGFQDHAGFTVSGEIYLPSLEALEELELEIGERYLIYTTDYYDQDWNVRSYMSRELPALNGQLFDAFDPEKLTILSSDEEISNNFGYNWLDVVAKYQFDGLLHGIVRWQFECVRNILFPINDQSAMPNCTQELDANGDPVMVILDYQTYPGKNGETITVTPEEYHERYREPTIVHLEGTAEEFLASEEGTLWREALYNVEINSHAFPMIGVDDMTQIADFANGMVDIVEGREFTDEELTRGDNVCILSQTLAELNGLSVGDTLTVQHYENDPGVPYQTNISTGACSLNPVAFYYFDNTMDLKEAVEYTIIGLYKQDVEWGNIDDNLYTFTPNTIFAPKESVTVQMDYGYAAFFRSFILQNGTIDEFQQAVGDAGYASMFYFNDNGYSAVEGSMDTYQEGASRAFLIGICVYGIVLLLFLVLYPARQGSVLMTMESLGVERVTRMGHVILDSVGIMVPGTLSGVSAGMLLWQYVVDALTEGSAVALGIEMRVFNMVAIAGAQLAIAVVFTVCIALFMARGKSLMKKK